MKNRWTSAFRGGTLLAVALGVALSLPTWGQGTNTILKVGSYNIRLSGGATHVADNGTPNTWESRKADLVQLLRRLDLDVFGLQ